MDKIKTTEGDLNARDMRFVIVASRFNDFIVESLIKGSVTCLRKHGASDTTIEIIRVPGAYELPLAVEKIAAAKQADGIIALDNGTYKIWFARNYLTQQPNTILLDNALATMGAGLPSAMMTSMLYTERRVMAICGDGGFMMNSQEMETAVRLGLNLVVLVLDDNSYGMIRWKQGIAGFDDWGLTFNNPDFVKYADSYGATGHRIAKTEEFVPTLNGCFEQGGVHLVAVPVDYSENKRVLIDELAEKVCLI